MKQKLKYLVMLFALLISFSFFSMLNAQTSTPIATIIDNFNGNVGQSFVVEGVVTVGAESHHVGRLRAFIQDNSGKGIALDNGSITQIHLQNLVRGNYVQLTGTVSEYGGAAQLNNLTNIQHRGFEMVPVLELTIQEALNHRQYYGLFIKVSGNIVELRAPAGQGRDIVIEDETNRRLVIRIWDTFQLDISRLRIGTPIDVFGAVSVFNNTSQIVPGSQQDIVIKLTDPIIDNITFIPEKPFVDEEITVSAEIIDYDGTIVSTRFLYKTNNQSDFTETNLTFADNRYTAKLPPFNTFETDEGEYIFRIIAEDNDGNIVNSGDRKISVLWRRPVITNIMIMNNPEEFEELIVRANIIDSVSGGSIVDAKVFYTLNYSSTERRMDMQNISGSLYEGVLPGFSAGTIVNISIFAMNSSMLTTIEDQNVRYVFPVKSSSVMLRIAPKAYNIYEGEKVEIGYFAKRDDIVIIRIYNSEGKLIATPINRITSAIDGVNFYNWDGKDNTFRIVEPGFYVCHLEVKDRDTGRIRNANAPIVIGTRLK